MRRRSLTRRYLKGQTVTTTNKAPRFTGLAAIGALIALALAILACGGGATSSGSGGSPDATKAPAKVGDTITADNVSATLESVKKLSGDQFIKPKSGNQFVVVRVKIQNKGGDEVDYNPFDFHAKSSNGNITDLEIAPSTYKDNKELDSGKLAKGGSVEGDIIFQVPVDDHGAQLTWQPNFFDNNSDYVWGLGL